MIAHNPYLDCLDARPYYCDFLSEDARGGIPPTALEHMMRCEDCQGEIDRLKSLFERLDERKSARQSRKDADIIGLLALHLIYAGTPVTCSTARLFLAGMADPALKIRVETPITRHVDECQACQQDLRKLRELRLSHEQFCRLGQLLAYMPDEGQVTCAEAAKAIESAASMALHETDAETLKHLCTCASCREQLYRRRAEILRELTRDQKDPDGPSCEAISTSDIYDFCVPYGIEPADDDFVVLHEAVASHISSCADCLGRVQSLHETIYEIASRPDSGVVTYMTLGDESEQTIEAEPIGAPVVDLRRDVRTPDADDLEQTGSSEIIPASSALRLKRRISSLNLRRYAKPAIAAAAIMTFSAVSYFTARAHAVDSEIEKAFKAAENVHIIRYIPGRMEPVEETWVSRPSGLCFHRAGANLTLRSISDRVRKTKDSLTAETRVTPLESGDLDNLQKALNSLPGVAAFDDASELPPDHKWTKLPPELVATPEPGVEVHELTFSKNVGPNRTRLFKRLFFVDSQTNRPKRVEIYSTLREDEDHELSSWFVIEYPTESQIRAAIEAASF